MVKQVTEPPPPLPEWTPPELNELVFAMLEKEPGARPQLMREVVETLDRLSRTLKTNDFTPQAPASGAKERTPTPVRPSKKPVPTPARTHTPARGPTPSKPAPTLTVEPAPTLSKAAPAEVDDELDAPPPSSSKLPLVIGLVLVVVVIGAGAVLVGGNTVEPKVEVVEPVVVETPPPTKVEPPPAKPVEVQVRVESEPVGAEVLEDGVVLGNTPLTLKRVEGTVVDLTLSLSGYETTAKKLRLSADAQTVSFKLDSTKKRPEPRVEPKGEPKKPAALKDAPDFGTPPAPSKAIKASPF
jgi:serine/threonine-protein kinase